MTAGDFRCVAIDTATDEPGVAICDGERRAEIIFGNSGKTERIYQHITALLADMQLELVDLDCIAVGCGPGSFTGLRVGVAAAQALAFGARLPVCAVSSLELLAVGASRIGGMARVAATLDARMDEVYAGYYHVRENSTEVLMADCVNAPDRLDFPGADRFIAAGPGWQAYPQLGKRLAHRIDARLPDARPRAADLLVLAGQRFAAGQTQAATNIAPHYLRERVTG